MNVVYRVYSFFPFAFLAGYFLARWLLCASVCVCHKRQLLAAAVAAGAGAVNTIWR